MSTPSYPRDMIGYGRDVPALELPGDARIAVQFVINYEEGAESSVLHGDPASEVFLSDIVGASAYPDRHMSMESLYEYGSRAGFWRLYRFFTELKLPVTVFGVSRALEANPPALRAMLDADWEIACHGLRWISYQSVEEAVEREHIRAAIDLHTRLTGSRPLGWYTGRDSPNTRRLVLAEGGFLYDSDSYADDLPFWIDGPEGPHLIIPYALDTNDMRFATPQGFNAGDQFFNYLRDAFDVLYEEGAGGTPRLLNIGLHCRLAGRPGRFAALRRFAEHVLSRERVWVCRRIDIARHWHEHHKP